jgi:hypothetical protein
MQPYEWSLNEALEGRPIAPPSLNSSWQACDVVFHTQLYGFLSQTSSFFISFYSHIIAFFISIIYSIACIWVFHNEVYCKCDNTKRELYLLNSSAQNKIFDNFDL